MNLLRAIEAAMKIEGSELTSYEILDHDLRTIIETALKETLKHAIILQCALNDLDEKCPTVTP